MEIRKLWMFACFLTVLALLPLSSHGQAPASNGGTAKRPAAGNQQNTIVVQGKARFQAYMCYDCHGENGEGTADAPDLTHSHLTAEQVSKFLQKPSVDAQNKGMPDVPTSSPDHQPLVAYVMSLRAGGAPAARAATAPASTAPKPAAMKGNASPSTGNNQEGALVAQGKARFQAYMCYDCHGEKGEGTADAPDLTHSHLTAEQVSKFLQKPSVDAQNKGMPDVPTASPDHKPLVAFIMSLRAK
jgi:cytochrome c553